MSNKLNPIYAALDNHQYSRAIKLCLGLSNANNSNNKNILSQALLAVAYAKNSQRPEAFRQLQLLLPETGFPELRLVWQYIEAADDRLDQQQMSTQTTPTATSTSSASKKGGKKKKGATKSKQPPASTTPVGVVPNNNNNSKLPATLDLIDLLDNPPRVPTEAWNDLPTTDATTNANILLDTVVLGTISWALSILSLPLTNYQLYCWAVANANATEEVVTKAINKGIAVVLAPHYAHMVPDILAHLQVLSLQLSRMQPTTNGGALAWAAQMALWQIQEASACQNKETEELDSKHQVRLAMLPRLAESMASKCLENMPENNASSGGDDRSQVFHLYLRALACQDKWQESLRVIRDKSSTIMSETDAQVLEVEMLEKLDRVDEALQIVTDHLLTKHPDSWEYWQMHLRLSLALSEAGGSNEERLSATYALAESLKTTPDGGYPVRGPHLIQVDICTRGELSIAENRTRLVQSLKDYAEIFAGRVSCAFNDLRPYLEGLLKQGTEDDAQLILAWLTKIRIPPGEHRDDPSQRRSELRRYIFATQMMYVVLVQFPGLEDSYLPRWQDLIQVWREYQNAEPVVQAQVESRPADELVLLATQQLIRGNNPSMENCHKAAVLLESGLQYSPSNAYLKVVAMCVYGKLDAASRSLELFSELMIKHIQLESCSYLVLSILEAGGLYREILSVCKRILQLQRTSAREAADFTVRAIRNNNLSKADEFIRFHRTRLNRSLTTVEAKGLILDCAPMFQPDDTSPVAPIGAYHGIVGIETDAERASQMITEGHNPYGAFSLLGLRGGGGDGNVAALSAYSVSDNRDSTILHNDIFGPKKFDKSVESIIESSMRRGYHHGLLIRACLCVDVAVGPKKGKLVKPTELLRKRCHSLLKISDECLTQSESWSVPSEDKLVLRSTVSVCRAISLISGGPVDSLSDKEDSLASRESAGLLHIQEACSNLQSAGSIVEAYTGLTPVSHILPSCIVPLSAAFRMFAKVLEKYGWGHRKRRTKVCAGALAELAIALRNIVSSLSACVARQAAAGVLKGEIDEGVSDFVDSDTYESVTKSLHQSRAFSSERIQAVLDELYAFFNEFDVD